RPRSWPDRGPARRARADPVTTAERESQAPRTTLPAAPSGKRVREPRELSVIRFKDIVAIIGAAVAGAATAGVLWQEISPFSGLIGYIIVAWCLFVLYYALLISFDEDRPTMRDRVAAVVVQSLALLVVGALFWVTFYTLIKAFPALRHLNF